MVKSKRMTGTVASDKAHIDPPFVALGYNLLSDYLRDLCNGEVEISLLIDILRMYGDNYSLPDNAVEEISFALQRIEHYKSYCKNWWTCELCRFKSCKHTVPGIARPQSTANYGPAGLVGMCRKCYKQAQLSQAQQAIILVVYGSLDVNFDPMRDEKYYRKSNLARELIHQQKEVEKKKARNAPMLVYRSRVTLPSKNKTRKKQKNRENAKRQRQKERKLALAKR